jgi:hypothetical protein
MPSMTGGHDYQAPISGKDRAMNTAGYLSNIAVIPQAINPLPDCNPPHLKRLPMAIQL